MKQEGLYTQAMERVTQYTLAIWHRSALKDQSQNAAGVPGAGIIESAKAQGRTPAIVSPRVNNNNGYVGGDGHYLLIQGGDPATYSNVYTGQF